MDNGGSRDAGSQRGRVRARRCAVQALYQWQLAGQEPRDILNEFIAEREILDVDMGYFAELTRGIPSHIQDLETLLAPVLDRSFASLDPVERAILLIGAYELRYCPEVPWRVAINEAVELTKMFGAEQAHRFVNGALDKLGRHLRPIEAGSAA
jgi:N utilization substance protein B